jgi:hypothetical protein
LADTSSAGWQIRTVAGDLGPTQKSYISCCHEGAFRAQSKNPPNTAVRRVTQPVLVSPLGRQKCRLNFLDAETYAYVSNFIQQPASSQTLTLRSFGCVFAPPASTVRLTVATAKVWSLACGVCDEKHNTDGLAHDPACRVCDKCFRN